MKRIGILGGTFNPIHIGHLAVAQVVLEEMGLDKVYFVPSNLPPHKSGRNIIPAKHRLAMIRLAIRDNSGFALSDFETKRPGKSYSIKTAEHFLESFPSTPRLYFIVGSDMLEELHTWKEFDKLRKKVTFVAVVRKGFEKVRSKVKVRRIDMLDLGISSSYIRRCIKRGKTVKYLLPGSVLGYIQRNKLYSK